MYLVQLKIQFTIGKLNFGQTFSPKVNIELHFAEFRFLLSK